MNNIILTAFENGCPLNSFNFPVFEIMKITTPKIIDLTCILCTIGFCKYIQYHVLLRHVPVCLLHLIPLIAVK